MTFQKIVLSMYIHIPCKPYHFCGFRLCHLHQYRLDGPSLRPQVCEEFLLWGLKYVDMNYFGPFGAPGISVPLGHQKAHSRSSLRSHSIGCSCLFCAINFSKVLRASCFAGSANFDWQGRCRRVTAKPRYLEPPMKFRSASNEVSF